MKYGRRLNRWQVTVVVLLVLLALPVISILLSLAPASLLEIPTHLLSEYSLNTLWLALGTGVVSLLIGVPTAWYTATYNFPGRKVFSWALTLPLAIPAYIMAFIYKGIFDPFGTLHRWFGVHAGIDNIAVLSLLMGLSLYPYVYVVSRATMMMGSASLMEAARALGAGKTKVFFEVILPVSRPAIFSGLLLVVMEVLNNYGAVSYFGIPTYTTEIIRLWNPMDIGPVFSISTLLILLVVVILLAERQSRRRARFNSRDLKKDGLTRTRLKGWAGFMATIVCLLPLVLGFVVPVTQLLGWAWNKLGLVLDSDILQALWTTFTVAGGAALIAAGMVLLINFVIRYDRVKYLKNLGQLPALGYAVPGVLLGIGILLPMAYLNRWLAMSLTGSLYVLAYAYVVRFYAVAHQTIQSGFEKLSPNINEAAASLGRSKWFILTKVDLPLIKPAFWSAVILVFVDITKELPLTMMFQSFNFETLAVKTFKLIETDGALYDASVPALIIIALGLLPVLLVTKLIQK